MLIKLIDLIFYNWLNLNPQSRFAQSVHFFIYDTIKIFLLLVIIIFVISFIRTYFTPEKVRLLLAKRNKYIGNILAALLGIVTPFCSCSAVPLFIGFIEAGVPLGVTFSFLVSSPAVNEVALIMLWGLLGYKIALLYIATGFFIAVASGIIIGELKMEKYVADYIYEIKREFTPMTIPTLKERLEYAESYVKNILGKIWIYVLAGVGLGAVIHGYVPENFLLNIAGKKSFLAVPIVVLIGVPLYSNAAGIIPIVKSLIEKGMAVGTALSFMMAVTALSLPEIIILRTVLKPRLLAIFVIILTISIIAIGYLFNFII